MKLKILLCAAALLLADAALAQPIGDPDAPSADPALPDGPGKTLVQRTCAQCHGLDVALIRPLSRDEWAEVVSRMIGHGAHLNDDESLQVIDYLAKTVVPPTPARLPRRPHF
jgi:mono/diheme cytochrome c family protein